MDHAPLPRRYLMFFAGVVSSALGIALITLAGMGTSAVSGLAYVLTFVFPGVSLGCFTFLVNCAMLGDRRCCCTGSLIPERKRRTVYPDWRNAGPDRFHQYERDTSFFAEYRDYSDV